MLSYALATLRLDVSDEIEEIYSKDSRSTGKFGYIKTREASIIKELDKYDKPQQEIIDRLNDILDNNDFNIKMLVAADIWYRGNDLPTKFTPEMFTMANSAFSKITENSFEGNKVWDRDSLGTLLTYANYLKQNVYIQSGRIIVESGSKDNDDLFDYNEDDNDEDY